MAEIPKATSNVHELTRSNASGAYPTTDNTPTLPPFASAEPIPISVFSNSRLLREALVNMIKPHLMVYLVGSYTGEKDLESELPNPARHVVLIDSGIGQQAASLWTQRWRADHAQVLLLELADNKEVILACIEMGANGYTLRESEPVEVAHAIYMISQGLAICSPMVTAHLFARLASLRSEQTLKFSSQVPLTVRELEVLRLVAQGHSNKEIASVLTIEIYTVKHHVHNILEKLQMAHRRDAARFAADQGWLDRSSTNI